MQKKFFNLKNKILNQLTIGGNKFTCEVSFFKDFKFVQKSHKKNHKNIFKLSIKNSSPIIKMRQTKKKKRKNIKKFPYILNKNNRIFFGIKFILIIVKKKKSKKLFQEFINFSKKKNESLIIKKTENRLALTQKKYIFFRWFY